MPHFGHVRSEALKEIPQLPHVITIATSNLFENWIVRIVPRHQIRDQIEDLLFTQRMNSFSGESTKSTQT